MNEQGKLLNELLAALVNQMAAQTAAIQALADSNQQLIRAMAETDAEYSGEDLPISALYLSGKSDR